MHWVCLFLGLGDLCLALHLSVFCGTYVGHWVCLFVSWGDLCRALHLSVFCGTYVWHWVCLFVFVGLMFGIAFVSVLWDLCRALGLSVFWLGDLCWPLGLSVCFCGTYVGHWVCMFVFVGLMFGNGCYLEQGQLINCFWNIWDLCLALHLSVFCETYVGHWVCLFVSWGTYVGHCIYLCFVGLMLGNGFVSLLVGDLCRALGLSVCWLWDLCLALGLSVCFCGTYVWHWVCLFVFVRLM